MVTPLRDHCAVKRCPNPVAYVLEGEAELEDGSRFATGPLPICQEHRNRMLQADLNLLIRPVEEVVRR